MGRKGVFFAIVIGCIIGDYLLHEHIIPKPITKPKKEEQATEEVGKTKVRNKGEGEIEYDDSEEDQQFVNNNDDEDNEDNHADDRDVGQDVGADHNAHVVVQVKMGQEMQYIQHFEGNKAAVKRRFPNVSMQREDYPLPFYNQCLGYLIFGLQLFLGALILFGDVIFQKLNITPPGYYELLKKNKLVAGVIVYFAGNMLKSQFTSVGAYEVLINGGIEFSKLTTGGLPSNSTILTKIKQVIQLGDL